MEEVMEEYSKQYLNLVRKKLYRRLPSLAAPMGHLEDAAEAFPSGEPCGTDGSRLFWNPRYLPDPSEHQIQIPDTKTAESLLLHTVIHCLFIHPFHMPSGRDPEVWSLACDIAAWHIGCLWLPELMPGSLMLLYESITAQASKGRKTFCLYDPRSVLDLFADSSFFPWFEKNRENLIQNFCMDDHSKWPVFSLTSGRNSLKKNSGGCGNDKMTSWKQLQKQFTGKNAPLSPEKHSRKKNTFSGTGTESRRKTLFLTDTRRHDYRNLLKSLADWGEDMRLNPSEFQYAPYLYGLEHYGNLPLIEPLEYEEAKKIRELAIVIDTSGSCSRSLTQAFLEETRNLIQEETLFFHPFNLHILQCDVKVQRDDKLTSLEDLEHYIETLEICGMGGTDFCPAFSHIEMLQKSREFTHLSGILYFTDGLGIYPPQKPDVRTVFIFLNKQFDAIDIPPWAETLVLDTRTPKGNDYEY